MVGTPTALRLLPAPRYDPPYDDELPDDAWPPDPAQPFLDFSLAAAPRQPVQSTRVAAQPASRLPDHWAADGRVPGFRVAAPPAATPAASPSTTAAAVRFVNTSLEIFNGYRPTSHFRALANPLAASAVVTEMTHAMRRLQRATGRSGPPDTLIKVRRMRTCEPRPGVAEIAAVISIASRSGPPSAASPPRAASPPGATDTTGTTGTTRTTGATRTTRTTGAIGRPAAALARAGRSRLGPGQQAWALAFRLEQYQGRWLCTAAKLL